ncbi:class I SAM-dependent methyltransferase [Thalassospira sp. CH_XMU1448-2]|uniref:class I SAM-dependent methyltransferase n=1 Tax=Thalassospira sp. CH_XMU1448-2 TaxID=3107773 RepID=UPI00300ADBAC
MHKSEKKQSFETEISKGDRFAFGENWQNFSRHISEVRIQEAEKSLQQMLSLKTLSGKTFLDIGCGSGLFSLAARRLGATVHSFDYDQNSVNCALVLKEKFFPNDETWIIEQGSVLDSDYINSIGQFDIVYSWGVLHHTGEMWNALSLIHPLTRPDGKMFIALYNDQGRSSVIWAKIKKAYCVSPKPIKTLILAICILRLWGPRTIIDTFKGNPLKTWNEYKKDRGMTPVYDAIDWVGGYPFEVAKPEEIFDFFKSKNFNLEKISTCAGGIGCNEFVFSKKSH